MVRGVPFKRCLAKDAKRCDDNTFVIWLKYPFFEGTILYFPSRFVAYYVYKDMGWDGIYRKFKLKRVDHLPIMDEEISNKTKGMQLDRCGGLESKPTKCYC